MKRDAYAQAGVDIGLSNKVKASLPAIISASHRSEVLGKVGGFGGLFALNTKKYTQPVLVSSVDGVGTKLKVAFATNRHDTIGCDLVNHCVNDIIVLGAEPLFFLDYLGAGKLQPKVFKDIVTGIARACAENGCALIGGETAQMPGFYQTGEYDVCGAIVGVVDKAKILDGKTVKAGDVIIGLASNGLHTNGYSLARKIFFDQMNLKPSSRLPGLSCSIGQEMLKIHLSYLKVIRKLLTKYNLKCSSKVIKGLAHITGGGFIDNIPRVTPDNCDVLIHKKAWDPPPIFKLLKTHGRLPDAELFKVFNMGIGMTLTVSKKHVGDVLKSIRLQKFSAYQIGEVIKGTGHTKIV
jgi:phosphoribosylformylglycinamidine cyclo-ligase